MSRLPRAPLLAALALLFACREGSEQGAIDAARADSSAAGYAVGGTPASSHPAPDSAMHHDSVPPARAESIVVAARHAPASKDTTGTKHRPPHATDSARRSDSTRVAARDSSARHTTESRTTPTPVATGPVRVNEFLTYDARSRTASVQLVAGYNGVNGSLNYNGATRGTRVVAVPLGWHVHVTVSNHDTDLQHSAIVVQEVLPPPLELTTPAFSGAALPHLDEGLHEDETGTLDFVATRAGRYMMACGVPGHAQSGMWLRLLVTTGIAVPAYR